MVPSGIQRDEKEGVSVRTLQNGAVVVVNAYEGRYELPGSGSVAVTEVQIDNSQPVFDRAYAD
ncbi:MAG: hypothetical protein QOH86_2172 [Sphingomonadales bacterium]|nr:hypothetical protein [Sphingomonadales bacterium]